METHGEETPLDGEESATLQQAALGLLDHDAAVQRTLELVDDPVGRAERAVLRRRRGLIGQDDDFRTMTGHFSLCGEGLCIGYDSGDAASKEYAGTRFEFTGG